MTKYLSKAVLCVLMLTGLPALAHAQGTNNCDFDGDGKTDTVVARDAGGQIQWWILRSTAGLQVLNWGASATDFILCGDYDGDGKSDATLWRTGAAGVAGFWVMQSSTGFAQFEAFGQTGDDAQVVGDYNGDGRDDFAVWRPGANPGDQSTFFYRTTSGGAVTYVPWGSNGNFAAPFDFDGDGKLDPMVQRDFFGSGQIWILRSSNGAIAVNHFGLPTDIMVLGNWFGDVSEDLSVSRIAGGAMVYWTSRSTTGAVTFGPWGVAGDRRLTGDWDGDGISDRAIWRSSTGVFWVNRSTAGLLYFRWGAAGDYPAAAWRVK